jgi:signal transduction histidine kinase
VPAAFDRDAVSQVVQNLLDNAEKYTRDITSRVVRVAMNDRTICVADNGPGLPPEIRGRLFEPFVRGNHSDAPAGLGLGLALVKALAHAQHAEVRYADVPGGGAEFSVRFPA